MEFSRPIHPLSIQKILIILDHPLSNSKRPIPESKLVIVASSLYKCYTRNERMAFDFQPLHTEHSQITGSRGLTVQT